MNYTPIWIAEEPEDSEDSVIVDDDELDVIYKSRPFREVIR